MKVLVVDQWTSTGNVTKQTMRDFELALVEGGDSEAIKAIGVARARFKDVTEDENPIKGDVWYRQGPEGKLVLYKANYDSSD